MNRKNLIKFLCIIFLGIGIGFYLYFSDAYSIFESVIDGFIKPDIATWKIKVNDVLVTTVDPVSVNITSITWSGEHVADNKVAPGSIGSLDINIDPTDTDVAIRYDIEVIDKNINPDKLLTVHSVTHSSDNLVRTGISTYTGIITLDEIDAKSIEHINLNVEWIDDNTEINFDDLSDDVNDYLEINFRAVQYRGEEIIPYVS